MPFYLGQSIGEAAPIGEGRLDKAGEVAEFPDNLTAAPGAGGGFAIAGRLAGNQQPVDQPVTLGRRRDQVARPAAALDAKLRAIGMVEQGAPCLVRIRAVWR
jgi:hypothetical protein